jgi:hypothetical protein
MRRCSVSIERVFVQVREPCPDGAPGVLGSGSRQACPDGVLEDVVDGGGQVDVAVEDACGEAIAEEVAGADVAAVEALCVEAVEAAEAVRQLPARAREDEVVVVRHQAERDDVPPLLSCDVRQEGEEGAPVVVVTEDRAPVDALDRDVVDAVGEVTSRDARHGLDARPRAGRAPSAWDALPRFRHAWHGCEGRTPGTVPGVRAPSAAARSLPRRARGP